MTEKPASMNEDPAKLKEKLLTKIREGWKQLQDFIGGYTDEQLTTPTDAAGWTAKDHLIHLAVWQNGMTALLDKQPRRGAMGLSEELWDTLARGYDEVNAAIQQQHEGLSIDEVRGALEESHQEFVARIEALPAEELVLPYKHFQPWAENREEPVIAYLAGNSFGHSEQHIPWMRTIIEG
ncbi:MAG: ClbS/DfsB family four-helix bundle protein [Anaerolineales bacterium]|nr:ClbS/DfsB family four-helix bundle protein [Anaerolineales bacterium]